MIIIISYLGIIFDHIALFIVASMAVNYHISKKDALRYQNIVSR